MDKMDHNAHSVYLMYYHLIMVVKYRRKVIDDPISERAKAVSYTHLDVYKRQASGYREAGAGVQGRQSV